MAHSILQWIPSIIYNCNFSWPFYIYRYSFLSLIFEGKRQKQRSAQTVCHKFPKKNTKKISNDERKKSIGCTVTDLFDVLYSN